jgi:hypothetical protein
MAVIAPPYALPELRPFRTMAHRLRLVGGAVITANGALQSEDYVPGVSGWIVLGDGTVEFNDGVFRGEIDTSGLNITFNEEDGGDIEFYSAAGNLVGRLSPGSWEIGDLDAPGQRAVLDPVGGLRFRSDTDQLLNLIDQQGVSIRDEDSGTVVAELTRNYLRLVDVEGEDEVSLSSSSEDLLAKPRYTGASKVAPLGALAVPAATKLTNYDLELAQVAAFRQATVQAATHTPPAGWTEILDHKYGLASTLATSIARRAPATGTAATFTSSQTNWNSGTGTHVILRGPQGGPPPTVRAISETEVTSTATVINVPITAPAGTVAGDILVVFVSMGNAAGSVPTGWVTPEGWVFLGAQVVSTGTPTSTLAVGTWAKLVGPDDGPTYDTTINFGVGTKTVHAAMVAVAGASVILGGPQLNVGGFNVLGAWQPYTPANASITVGNGTLSGDYLLMGTTCFWRFGFVLGTTSSIGTANIELGLPFPAAVTAGNHVAQIGAASLIDASAFWAQTGMTRILSGGVRAYLHHTQGGANFGHCNNANPFTWGNGDVIHATGVYEIGAATLL